MKMNSINLKIKILLLTLLLGGMLESCEKMLDPATGENQYSFDRVINDPGFAEGFVSNGYYNLPYEYTFDDVATDDAVTNVKNNNYLYMATGAWSPMFNPFNNWTGNNNTRSGGSSAYAVINDLNFFLSIVNDVHWNDIDPEKEALIIKKFTAEARALRGYYYMQLLTRFGGIGTNDQLLGVPLYTEPLGNNDNWKLERASFANSVQQINSDFDAAIAALPDIWEDIPDETIRNMILGVTNQNRMNGRIVRALKSKLQLLAASPAFNGGSYDETKCAVAADAAADLINLLGGLSALPSDYVIWNTDGDINNADVLWRNDFVTNRDLEEANYPPSLYGRGMINPTQNLVNTFPMRNGYPINHGDSGWDANDPYASRDLRLAANILYNGMTLRSTVINTASDSPTDDGLNKVNTSTRTGYYLLKFLRTTVNVDPVSPTTARHFFTHLRWTEIFLNYAEAANEAWGPDDDHGHGFTAREVIGAIRARAGITQTGTNSDAYLETITTKEQMRELIRDERRLELCFEGHRFWDLRRWQANITESAKGVSITAGAYSYPNVEVRNYTTPAAYYGPIPLSEILKNDKLIQNKGW